jgi:hypothetical protein
MGGIRLPGRDVDLAESRNPRDAEQRNGSKGNDGSRAIVEVTRSSALPSAIDN